MAIFPSRCATTSALLLFMALAPPSALALEVTLSVDNVNYHPRATYHRLRPQMSTIDDPSMLIRFVPLHSRANIAFIICPGSGYLVHHLWDYHVVALWLNGLGITAYILKYRVISEGHHWPAPLEDMALALGIVRQNVSNGLVGVIGFSAGGHIASYAATRGTGPWRPDLQILVAPTIDTSGWKRPWPTAEHSTHHFVDEVTPPAFVVCSTEDVESSDAENCAPYVARLRAHGLPVEHVVRPMGMHGFRLCGGWTDACELWLTMWAPALRSSYRIVCQNGEVEFHERAA